MHLEVTLANSTGDDFVRTFTPKCEKDFDAIARAAGTWAKQHVRAVPLFGIARACALKLSMQWVSDGEEGLATRPTPQPKGKHARKPTRSRR